MNKINLPFYASILGGILVWIIIFLITPALVTKPVLNETVLFVVGSYLALISGYKFRFKSKVNTFNLSERSLFTLISFIVICFVFRYIDLFFIRGLRFSNTILQNRILAESSSNSILLIFASVFKSIYFIPLLLILLLKDRNKSLLIVSVLLFLLPFPEAILKGTRSTFFQSIIFLSLILVFTKTLKITLKSFLMFVVIAIGLFFISTQILAKREFVKNKNPYGYLVEKARYNDLLMPKQSIINYMNEAGNSNFNKKIGLSALQIGQYYTHGVFEFNYVIDYYKKNPFKKQYGKYTFSVIPKFTNKIGVSNYDLHKIYLASPRGYTFISFFGGLYIDFGWFALAFFFLLGILQKYLFIQVTNKRYSYAPLLVFLLFTNFFMLTFNFFRGSGTYTLISCVIFVLIYELTFKKLSNKFNEKSIST